MKHARCFACIFWNHSERRPDGECRKLPPTIARDDDVGVWPFTSSGDWCGSFRPEKLCTMEFTPVIDGIERDYKMACGLPMGHNGPCGGRE